LAVDGGQSAFAGRLVRRTDESKVKQSEVKAKRIIPVVFQQTMEFTPQEIAELKLQQEINAMVRGELVPRSLGCALANPNGFDCGSRTPRRMGS